MMDWFKCIQAYNLSHIMLFAPEPKLQAYGLGWGRGGVLAEDFYAATFLRMHAAYVRGDYEAAWAEEKWKFSAEAVFNSFPGAPKRMVYQQLAGINMGQPRLPAAPFIPSQAPDLFARLQAVNFFNNTIPPTF
eukprot:m.35797 g.35797  ORF g.35797 m.35797 type:complete len:133 (-) comp5357_c0_seq1:1421-1819(-)